MIDTLLSNAQIAIEAAIPGSSPPTAAQMLAWYTNKILTGSSAASTGDPLIYGKQLEGLSAWAPPSLAVSFGPLLATDKSTNLSQLGNTYTQFVRPALLDGASSMLAIGSSEHPASPHFSDQQGLWESGQLAASPWTLAGVQALGATQTTTLNYP